MNLAAVVVELDGIAFAVVGLMELASPGILARWFGYDYTMLALALGLGVPAGWAALAILGTRHPDG